LRRVIYKNSGEIKMVPVGYWRNFLKPSLQAEIVSEGVLQ
jgi:ribosomal protein L9